jgi:hypothetical protein
MKKVTAGEKPLVRDRALVFSPRAPFAFVPKIPKKFSNEAGGAKGGFEGGISPRPPLGISLSLFFGRFCVSCEFAAVFT